LCLTSNKKFQKKKKEKKKEKNPTGVQVKALPALSHQA